MKSEKLPYININIKIWTQENEKIHWDKYSIEKLQAYYIQTVQITPQNMLEGPKKKYVFKIARAKINPLLSQP